MTPDPIPLDAPETADADEHSRRWWLVVLLLSAVSWAALIAGGIALLRML